jgi:hypothetical protein
VKAWSLHNPEQATVWIVTPRKKNNKYKKHKRKRKYLSIKTKRMEDK